MAKKAKEFRKRMFEIVEIGYGEDSVSRGYDFFCAFVVILNLTVNVMQTFQDLNARFGTAFKTIDIAYIAIAVALMAVCSWISIPTACTIARSREVTVPRLSAEQKASIAVMIKNQIRFIRSSRTSAFL